MVSDLKFYLSYIFEWAHVCWGLCFNPKNKKMFKYNKFVHKHLVKVNLATVVEGDPKAPFSIATTLRCRGSTTPFPVPLILTI